MRGATRAIGKTEAGRDLLIDILRDKAGDGGLSGMDGEILATRALSMQDQAWFDKLDGERRGLLLERLRDIAGREHTRDYAEQVLRKLGDEETAELNRQRRRHESLALNRPLILSKFGAMMADRVGTCTICGRQTPLRAAVFRLGEDSHVYGPTAVRRVDVLTTSAPTASTITRTVPATKSAAGW